MRVLVRAVLLLPLVIGFRFCVASVEQCAAECAAATACRLPVAACPALLDCADMPPAERLEPPATGQAPAADIATLLDLDPAKPDGTIARHAAAPVGSSPLWLSLRRLLL